MTKANTPDPAAPSAYERSEVAIRALVIFAICLALAIVIASVTARWLWHEFGEERSATDKARHPMAAEREVPPQPQLQADPAAELSRYREREEEALSTYGWIDRQAGVVRIPIERAMQVVLERGLVPHSDGERPPADREKDEH